MMLIICEFHESRCSKLCGLLNGVRKDCPYVLHASCDTFQLKFDIFPFQSVAVSLRTTRFNIQQFYMMLALR